MDAAAAGAVTGVEAAEAAEAAPISLAGLRYDSARILTSNTLTPAEYQKVGNLIFAECPRAVVGSTYRGTHVDLSLLAPDVLRRLHNYLAAVESGVAPTV